MRTCISHKEYPQPMPRDRICPERPSVSGETPVRYGLRGPRVNPQMVMTLSKEGEEAALILAANLLPTRFG